MSSEYGVYLRADISDVLAFLREELGLEFRQYNPEEKTYEAIWFSLTVVVENDHGLIDDVGIPFSRYPVSVSITRFASSGEPELREDLCRALSLLIGRELARKGLGSNIVVRDVQELLESNSIAQEF